MEKYCETHKEFSVESYFTLLRLELSHYQGLVHAEP